PGSVDRLAVGAQSIETGKYQPVRAIGAETYSRLVDWDDLRTCVLFGDGAGAAVLRPATDGSGILDTDLYSDGQYADLLYVPGGRSRHPATRESVAQRLQFLKMPKGDEVFKVAVRTLAEASLAIIEKTGFGPDTIDLLVLYQATLLS